MWCIRELSVERDCAESQSQQHLRLAITPNLLRLVLRTQPCSGLPAKFTVNLRMHCNGWGWNQKPISQWGLLDRMRDSWTGCAPKEEISATSPAAAHFNLKFGSCPR